MFCVSCVCTHMSWLANRDNLARGHVETYMGLALQAKAQYQVTQSMYQLPGRIILEQGSQIQPHHV